MLILVQIMRHLIGEDVAVLHLKRKGRTKSDSLTLRGDRQFVGEMKVAHKKLSLLGMSTYAELSINKNWRDLGGTGRMLVTD